VVQTIAPIRHQIVVWRGVAMVALTGTCVLGGAFVSQLV
jgi:hypothetical protein